MKLHIGVIQDIVKLLEAGNTIEDTMGYLGLSERSYYIWKKAGRKLEIKIERGEIDEKSLDDHDQMYLHFFQETKRAERAPLVRNVAIIQKAAAKQWQAAAWYLERRDHKNWGRKDRTENFNTNLNAETSQDTVKKIFKSLTKPEDDEV